MNIALTNPQTSIDLPAVALQRLSALAEKSGMSLKKYIEGVLLDNARMESPSPSGDSWFDNPENMRLVEQGMQDIEQGKCVRYTQADFKAKFGV